MLFIRKKKNMKSEILEAKWKILNFIVLISAILIAIITGILLGPEVWSLTFSPNSGQFGDKTLSDLWFMWLVWGSDLTIIAISFVTMTVQLFNRNR